MEVELHPNLASKTFITDLPLCRVLFEDNQHYPWLILVPRRPDISRMMELPPSGADATDAGTGHRPEYPLEAV